MGRLGRKLQERDVSARPAERTVGREHCDSTEVTQTRSGLMFKLEGAAWRRSQTGGIGKHGFYQ